MANHLLRSTEDSIIGGVCSGLAAFFDIPSILVRLLFIVMLFTGGGLLIYIIMWIAMPKQTNFQYTNMEERDSKKSTGKPNSGSILAGVILISLGAFFALKDYIDIDLKTIGPYVLIAAGVFLLVKGMQKS